MDTAHLQRELPPGRFQTTPWTCWHHENCSRHYMLFFYSLAKNRRCKSYLGGFHSHPLSHHTHSPHIALPTSSVRTLRGHQTSDRFSPLMGSKHRQNHCNCTNLQKFKTLGIGSSFAELKACLACSCLSSLYRRGSRGLLDLHDYFLLSSKLKCHWLPLAIS